MSGAIGIDLGGTKIEAQLFDDSWTLSERRRVETPSEYNDLVQSMADIIAWAMDITGLGAPIGVAAAGLVSRQTGLALTANLPATGRPFPRDIETASGQKITYVNDCRALTLSEAVFGAAKGVNSVAGLIIGTGIGGGLAIDGKLVEGPTTLSGEFGHMPMPGYLAGKHSLPIVECGCGRQGCIETYISGPGLERLAKLKLGTGLSVPEIAERRHHDTAVRAVYDIWLELVAGLLDMLVLVADPDIIVLGGGLSKIPDLTTELEKALDDIRWTGYSGGKICLAEGGDTSGARGAAFAAKSEVSNA